MTHNSTTAQRHRIVRRFEGVVVSDVMDKTIVVKIEQKKMHPKYLRQYSVTKKFVVHDPKNQYHVGDTVAFVECRPISKNKRWRVVENSN